MPWLIGPSLPDVALRADSSHSRRWKKLAAGCCALAGVVCGVARLAPAQTVHFAGVQTVLGAGFNAPVGTAVDGSGNVYVADFLNNTVKEIVAVNGTIPASPAIRTLGSGFVGPAGVAVDALGNVYVADNGDGTIKEMLAVSGSIPASPSIVTLITLARPQAVAVDASGDLYVSGGCSGPVPPGTRCGFVEELLAVGGSVSPSSNVAILPVSPSGPAGLAVDGNGNVYLADDVDNQVDEILAVNGSVSPTSAIRTLISFSGSAGAVGVAVNGSGDVFVSDDGTNAVYEVLAVNGSIPSPVTSNLIKTIGVGFKVPANLSLDSNGNLYVADSQNNRVVEVSPSAGNFGSVNVGATGSTIPLIFTFDAAGTLGSIAALTQGAPGLDFTNAGTGTCAANTAYTAGQSCTVNVAFTPAVSGNRFGAAVLRDSSGAAIATGYVQGLGVGPQVNFFPGTQSTIGNVPSPFAVAVDGSGNVYVADSDGGAVYKEVPGPSGYTQQGPIENNAKLAFGLAVDASGNVYISDTFLGVIEETPSAGGYTQSILSLGTAGRAVGFDGSGNIYVLGVANNSAYFLKETATPSGYIIRNTVSAPGTSLPDGFAVDGSGNVYISDTFNGRVIKETATGGGYVQSVIASGLGQPQQIAVDGNGNVYIAGTNANGVLKETWTGSGYVQSTLIGSPSGYGLAVDSIGNLYVGGSLLLKENYADPPTLTFTSTTDGVNTVSSTQTETLQNIGNAALELTVPSIGNNPTITTNFALDSSPSSACSLLTPNSTGPAILAADASCQLLVDFEPTVLGTTTGFLTLVDNNLNAPAPAYTSQILPLTGTQTLPTFTLYSSVASGGLLQGSSLTSTITITPQSGFTVDPTFTVSGLTSGLTASFSSNPASASSVVTFTATRTAALGPTIITITGTYGTQTATTQLYVDVIAPVPNLSVTPENMHMAAGDSITSTVTLTNPGYFPAGVSLAVTGLPSGVTASFAPAITTGTSVLTLVANNTVTPGLTFPSIVATSGPLSGNPNLLLTITSTEGSIWIGNRPGSLSALDLTGKPLYASTYQGGGMGTITSPLGLAFDASTNAWVASSTGIGEFSVQGVPLTSTPFTSGGVSNPQALAVDGSGQIWIANVSGTVSVLSDTGAAVSPSTGYSGPGANPSGIAIDISGNVWVASRTANTITRILGAATPVVPLATGAATTPGVMP